eukprot:6169681-Pyramimonas_sp.AAC.1
MFEVETEPPYARFNKADYTASSIDRAFISLPSHATQELSIAAHVLHGAAILSDQRLSDHAVISFTIGIKPRTPPAEQAAPPAALRDSNYAVYLRKLIDASPMQRNSVENRW